MTPPPRQGKKATPEKAVRRRGEGMAEPSEQAKAYASRAAARAAKRGRAALREAFYREMHGPVDHAALASAMGPREFPRGNTNRWVPIGPAVTLRGQAMSRPRTSGRIRDLAVSPDGSRAYAISAKGGVWYTGDAGATWSPVGGWAGRSVNPLGNGNMFSGGALLVDFSGGTAATDFVLVGTGEAVPTRMETGAAAQGGVGVLAGEGPMSAGIDADPWEPDSGDALLGGVGIRRLVRHPAAVSRSTRGATQDRVLAATSDGLYLGIRSPLPAVAAAPPAAPGQAARRALPARNGFTWAACAVAPKASPNNDVTDVVWLANGSGTRIVYARAGVGVFFSDNSGATATPIATLQAPGVAFTNRISLALVPGTTRMYVLAEELVGGVPTPRVWRLTDVIATPQAVVPVPGVPPDLFGDPTQPTQAHYDQAIAVETVGTNDRIYLGGSTVLPRNDAEGLWSAALFCFETPSPPAAVAALAPVTGVSRRTDPPPGDGADRDGLIGNNVHADVHVIRLAGPPATRHIWVGCDGGVYVSEHSGRVNSFASRNNGLATLEPIFMASHPTSSHFMFVGFQDNGSQVRVGDTVWEAMFLGDGGGTLFHPLRPDIIVSQYVMGRWNGAPASDYLDPLTRRAGNAGGGGREEAAAAWYSGPAVIADTPATVRVALGTNRVWLTDHLGDGTPIRWRTLPYFPPTSPPGTTGTERDTRPGGNDPVAQQGFGVPGIVNGNFVDPLGNSTADQVIDMVWQTGSDLLVLYRGGLVRYTNTSKPAGTWTTTSWLLTTAGPIPRNATMTAVATVPGSLDFFVSTLGDPADTTVETLWFFNNATQTFVRTGFRRVLDHPGPPAVNGPLDPVFAVVVDPANVSDVYVGTATGVWKGRRQAAGNWVFLPFMNGLPQATVQDLKIWQDLGGAATSPRLLRAAVQSRGMWEVDLAHDERRRTYVRVHPRDDRRMLPTPMANPRRRPGTSTEPVFASPDILVRPAWPAAAAPPFHTTISSANVPTYDLWTFQTAFRWLYPSCVADGRWSDAMRDLVRFHRFVLNLAPGATIDQTLWRHVCGGVVGGVQRGVRLLPDPLVPSWATVTENPAHALAVYRAPWHTTLSFNGVASEIDLMETVLPVRSNADEWVVFREPSTVDVLLHHRDSRPVPPSSAFVILLWRSGPTAAALLATGSADLPPYLAAVSAAPLNAPPAGPAGWNVATSGTRAMQQLPTSLDARLPRAVSIDVDLSAVSNGHRVMFLALVGSGVDDPVVPPVGAPANVADLTRAWPQAALRIVRVTTRT